MENLTLSFIIAGIAALLIGAIIYLEKSRDPGQSTLLTSKDKAGNKPISKIAAIFSGSDIGGDFWSELERAMIESDVGIDLTARLIESAQSCGSIENVKQTIAEGMKKLFVPATVDNSQRPRVVLVLGVNGVGKTTTIAKLAHLYQKENKRVLLVAADTFRAAAVDQLCMWGTRQGIEVVSQGTGADAAAVAFDGVAKAKARGYDVVIIDTAGRLHTKQNLMEELKKVARATDKAVPGAPHERILVLDATVGSNGLAQARQFHDTVGLTGAIVAKLDGTAKGGVLLSIADELKIPITHTGTGERMTDLKPFEPAAFVDSILK